MSERFAVAKLSVSIVAVLVSIASASVAAIAWHSSSETAQKQLKLSQQVYQYSHPVLSGDGGIEITSPNGKDLYDWFDDTDAIAPGVIPVAEWKKDKIFIYARLSNKGSQAALLANYGLGYKPNWWEPASASDAVCKTQAFLPWKPCDQDGQLVKPGQILFIGFHLTRYMVSLVLDSFRKEIEISYEAGAYNVQHVILPISIPRRSVLGY